VSPPGAGSGEHGPWGRLPTAAFWLAAMALAGGAAAQELEPRNYASAPVGLQFVIVGGGHASGDLIFDPSLPVEDARASLDFGLAAYARTFSLWGRVAKAAVAVPWFDGQAEGLVAGVPAERVLKGMGDPRVAVTWLFYGAPARAPAAFAAGPRSPSSAGVSLTLAVPAGEYDAERLLNLGTNRWTLKTEVGASHRLGRWWVEGATAVSLFTTNDEFRRSLRREQAPIYSVQGHLVWEPRARLWLALDGTYYWGGQVRVEGTRSGSELGNSKVGVTASLPVALRHAVKLTLARGLSTRTGTNLQTVGVAWQWTLVPTPR
jgi:outer membrane putative beta-barrel porin/alpha-amylase